MKMRNKALLAGVASLALIFAAPQASFAQHGGGGGSHGGGGGGFHSSGGGGFHGSSGEFHGGSSYGGERGGSSYSGSRSSMGREAGSAAGRSSQYGRADTSPGWHSLGRSGAMDGAARAGLNVAHGAPEMHAALADGQWHSFAGSHAALGGGTHFGGNAEFAHAGFGGWGGGGWHGGFGWRGGWGYPGYGFGFGCWGCGWGFGFGWGIGWNPYWALYPYPYWDSLWWGDPYGYFGAPGYIYPYPW